MGKHRKTYGKIIYNKEGIEKINDPDSYFWNYIICYRLFIGRYR